MPRRSFKVGDLVTVMKYVPGKYLPGVKDEMGTEALFQSLVGKTYRIADFDRYGNLELWPKRLECIWIAPDLVELARPPSEAPRSQNTRLQRTRATASSRKRVVSKARR